jgi:hypothetical protein
VEVERRADSRAAASVRRAKQRRWAERSCHRFGEGGAMVVVCSLVRRLARSTGDSADAFEEGEFTVDSGTAVRIRCEPFVERTQPQKYARSLQSVLVYLSV